MNTRRLALPLRFLSFATVLCFSWSLMLASSVRAAMDRTLLPPGHRRSLSVREMQQIAGSYSTPIGSDPGSGGGAGGNAAQSPGTSFPWEGTVGGVKTGNGNKLTAIPLVSWQARGGLGVDFSLYHNSLSAFATGDSRGSKWTYGFDTAMVIGTGGNVKIAWGNGTIYVFTKNVDGSYTPPPGIHDHLVANGSSPISSFDLTTTSQVKYHLPYYSNINNYLLTAISDENGNTITINRASTGGELSVVDPTNRQITFGYNSTYCTSITDAKGRVFTFGYDANGNLSQVTYPTINGTSYSAVLGYDSNHNITSYKDGRGNTSLSSYNSDSTIAWQQDAIGNRTSFTYNGSATPGSGNTVITDANGHTVTHYYTGGVLSTVQDALNYSEYYTYDTANNVTQKQDRRGYLWKYTYDANGNVLTAKDPYSNTSTLTYNSHNRLLTAAAPLGRNAVITYDSQDNPTQVQEKDASGNVKATTNFTIGTYGLVSDKTDANLHKTLYTYDANGYLNSTTTPLGHQTKWTYDALGFQTSRLDAMSRTTTYTPDAWERLVTTTYPDSSTHTFSYDPNGNLTGWADPITGTWFRTYDTDNRILSEGNYTATLISHTYDAAGQKGLPSTTTDYFGRVITYAYSARNELAGVSEPAGTETYAYDPNGNQSHLYSPTGLRTDQYYNNDNTLHNYYNWNGGSTVVSSYGYTYNADHQITGLNEGTSTNTDTMPGPIQTTYGYDAQGHLNSESRIAPSSPFAKTYQFDPAGNRTYMNEGYSLTNSYAISTLTYDNDDELQSVSGGGSFAYTYNGNGDQITGVLAGATTTFGYDYDDQLTSMTKSGSAVSYTYDALGRQVSRTVNGTATKYYLDGDQVLFEMQGSSETAAYTWGNGLIRRNGEYPLYDGGGTARQTTNASQSVTASFVPDGFGRTVYSSGSSASPFLNHGAAGYRSDGDAPTGGEVYQKVGARYYDACFGRFITRDTDLSQHPYAYCDGDPVNFSDPSGHWMINIAHPGPDINTSATGSAADGYGQAETSTSSSSSSSGTAPINLSGVIKAGTSQQGSTTTDTFSVAVTQNRTTVTEGITFTFTPVHFVTSTLTTLGYNAGGGWKFTFFTATGNNPSRGGTAEYDFKL